MSRFKLIIFCILIRFSASSQKVNFIEIYKPFYTLYKDTNYSIKDVHYFLLRYNNLEIIDTTKIYKYPYIIFTSELAVENYLLQFEDKTMYIEILRLDTSKIDTIKIEILSRKYYSNAIRNNPNYVAPVYWKHSIAFRFNKRKMRYKVIKESISNAD